MSTLVRMPKLGESVVEGTVTRWLKAPGQRVDKLEPLLEISTDKIDTEIPAPAGGLLLEIIVAEGTTVAVGTELARIGEAEEGERGREGGKETERPGVQTELVADSQSSAVNHQSPEKPSGRAFISPVVNKIAQEQNVDLAQISGSGLGGRITKKDVLAFLESGDQRLETRRGGDKETGLRRELSRTGEGEGETSVSKSSLQSSISNLAIAQSQSPTSDEVLYPLSAMRRAIAQHMLQSKQTSPHVTTIFEVDMTAVVRHREAHKQAFADKGIALTFTPYFVAASARALRTVPFANGRFSEQGIVVNRRVHIGVAVAVQQGQESGLLVPVIRDCDEKNLAGLARAINDIADRARSNKLTPDELRGGTFTITNHGVGGSLLGTPIINQPQAAILGIGAIVKRPVVRSASTSLLPSADDAIVIRPMCYLSLSFDHRILDGASADAFLTLVKHSLENWIEQ